MGYGVADLFENAHAHSIDTIASALDTDPRTGLNSAAVGKRLDRYGPNLLRRREKKSALKILLHQFDSVIVWLLAVAAALSFFLGRSYLKASPLPSFW